MEKMVEENIEPRSDQLGAISPTGPRPALRVQWVNQILTLTQERILDIKEMKRNSVQQKIKKWLRDDYL